MTRRASTTEYADPKYVECVRIILFCTLVWETGDSDALIYVYSIFCIVNANFTTDEDEDVARLFVTDGNDVKIQSFRCMNNGQKVVPAYNTIMSLNWALIQFAASLSKLASRGCYAMAIAS